MPAVQITVPTGLPRAAVRQAMANVAAAMGAVLGSDPGRDSIWVNEVDRELVSVPGPFVHVLMLDGRPIAVLQHLIRQVTDGVAHALGSDPGEVRVVITPAQPDLWGIGGMPASARRAEEIGARARPEG